ncbi:MAG: preprotein translocase subunit YajC [Bacteroidales bacterium]|nr:preprotein translocase subunit YajC [Bacteroidales bacterium]
MIFYNLLLMAPTGEGGQGGGSSMIIFLVLMIAIFYFFMIRPQQKKQKKMQEFRSSLNKGDKIVTIGGIHGKIVNVDETTFVIEVEDGTKLRIDKAAVAIDANDMKNKQ